MNKREEEEAQTKEIRDMIRDVGNRKGFAVRLGKAHRGGRRFRSR